jgi:hypothetical protein
VSAPFSPRQSTFVGGALVLTLVQLLIGFFPFTNSVLIEGIFFRYSTPDIPPMGFALVFILWGIDLVIAFVFWWGVIQIASVVPHK